VSFALAQAEEDIDACVYLFHLLFATSCCDQGQGQTHKGASKFYCSPKEDSEDRVCLHYHSAPSNAHLERGS
jgi:hypothetical protein